MLIVVCSLKSMCVPSFIVIGYCVSELHGHPIIMYGVRLFNVVLEELHCLPNCLQMRVRGCYHFIKFHCSTPSGF